MADSSQLLDTVADRLGHRFHHRNFATPTRCDHCQLLLLGLVRQGLACDSASAATRCCRRIRKGVRPHLSWAGQ